MSLNNSDAYLATGFREVDASSDVGKFAACLRFLDGLPSVAAYKRRSFDLMRLQPGDVAVDLGCGLGFDLRRLADRVAPGGLAIGIDASRGFLEAARAACRGRDDMVLRHGDIASLAIDSGSVDAVRIDRTLQHVAEPQKVIAEMARILKPGGRLVCAEPDWFTFVIDTEDSPAAALVLDQWRANFRNPRIGRQLAGRIRRQGLREVQLEGRAIVADGLDAVDVVFDLRKTVSMLDHDPGRPRPDLAAWLAALADRDRQDPVTASVTVFLARGIKE